MTERDALRRRAEKWASEDPDQATQAELTALIAESAGSQAALDELSDRFAGKLEFGTAGLRGVLGAGPNRMNLAVVRAATAGLCQYLKETTPGWAERGICIGLDGRRMSREFAEEAAMVALGAGFTVRLFDRPVPTPVLGFACTRTNAAAGIMITASHNPPEYNGYKVYWGNGAQIVPPHDEGIAACIDRCGPPSKISRLRLDEGVRQKRLSTLGDEMEDAYHAKVRELVVSPSAPRDVVIAYTALHGVGTRPALRALKEAGFASVHGVAAQAEPDGAFPTVRFPNPEEKGAMDLVLALANEVGADLVLANDPDADRLAVAVKLGSPVATGSAVAKLEGGYQQLTGNDVGCLLAHYLLSQGDPSGRRLVVSSLVSSPMLGSIAAAHGARWEETLTGFKWIANRAIELEREGYRFVMGFEEALGYTVGSLVRDKDGVGAALVVADMAAWCKSQGRTLLDELELCHRRYGLYLSRQVSVTKKGQDGAKQIAAIMSAVRADPPKALGDYQVIAVQDLERGTRVAADGSTSALSFPSSNVIALEIEGGHRVMLRPSGTEPKIKYYFDVRAQVGEKEPVVSARERGEGIVEALVKAFVARVGS